MKPWSQPDHNGARHRSSTTDGPSSGGPTGGVSLGTHKRTSEQIRTSEAVLWAYPIRYTVQMDRSSAQSDSGRLLAEARHAAGVSQAVLAKRAGTSRTAISAYEQGAKSPSLDTAVRLLAAAGYELEARRQPEASVVAGARGRQITVLSALPRLPVEQALATVDLPLSLNWSQPGRRFDLGDRDDRARVYEIVLREGRASDLLAYVDGALLVDLWNDLVLPRDVRAGWAPVIEPLLADPNTASAIA